MKFCIRESAAVIKFWFHPDTREMIKFDRWDVHFHEAPKQYYGRDEYDTIDPTKTIENMYDAGWVRGALNHKQELDLNVGGDFGADYITKTLEVLPSEFLFVKDLVVDFNEQMDLSGEEAGNPYHGKTIPVDEGEDALSAWKNRNDLRKKVNAQTLKQVMGGGLQSYWISPEYKFFNLGETEHSDFIYNTSPYKEKAYESLHTPNPLEAEDVIGLAVKDGWTRINYWPYGQKGAWLSIQLGHNANIEKILSMIPDLPINQVMIDNISFENDGENLIDSYKHYMRRKHLVAQLTPTEDIITPSQGKITYDGWISPEGDTYPMSGRDEYYHSAWIRKYKNWLKQKYNFDLEESELDNLDIDYLRNKLIMDKGWIRVAGGGSETIFNVRSYSEAFRTVLEAVDSGMVKAERSITIYDRSTDKLSEFSVDDVERQLALASRKLFKNIKSNFDDFTERFDKEGEEVIRQFLSGKQKVLRWNKVSASRLKKIWIDYAKFGFVRDESGLDQIAESILDGIARLEFTTEMMGHTQLDPQEMLESMGYDFNEKQMNKLLDFLTDEHGNYMLSDYGLDPLIKLYNVIQNSKTAEDKLVAIDKALNITHQRSDLADFFIEGGSQTLSDIANQKPEPLTEEENEIKQYANIKIEDKMYIKLSSRDAVKDTINYWDKAKNKDFSKYWRKLRKTKSSAPNPIRKNEDYGMNWIERIKNREARLNSIVEADLIKTAFIRKEGDQWCVKSEKGKNMGCYDSESGAKKRLREIHYFKNK